MGKGIPCHSNSMSWVLSQWMDEKMKKKRWVIIDEKKDWVTGSKLTITVKTISKCNDRRRVVAK